MQQRGRQVDNSKTKRTEGSAGDGITMMILLARPRDDWWRSGMIRTRAQQLLGRIEHALWSLDDDWCRVVPSSVAVSQVHCLPYTVQASEGHVELQSIEASSDCQ